MQEYPLPQWVLLFLSPEAQREPEKQKQSEIKRKRDFTGAMVELPSPLVPVDFPITH